MPSLIPFNATQPFPFQYSQERAGVSTVSYGSLYSFQTCSDSDMTFRSMMEFLLLAEKMCTAESTDGAWHSSEFAGASCGIQFVESVRSQRRSSVPLTKICLSSFSLSGPGFRI